MATTEPSRVLVVRLTKRAPGRTVGALLATLAVVGFSVPPQSAPAAATTAAEFFARSPLDGGISCAIYDGYAGSGEALCESFGPKRQTKATLYPNGHLTLCATRNLRANRCDLGNAGEGTPTFGYGHRVTVGRFRCVVLRNGVRCTVRSSGEGFLFNPRRATPVGGAEVRVVRSDRRR